MQEAPLSLPSCYPTPIEDYLTTTCAVKHLPEAHQEQRNHKSFDEHQGYVQVHVSRAKFFTLRNVVVPSGRSPVNT